jgi:hypothetical protein
MDQLEITEAQYTFVREWIQETSSLENGKTVINTTTNTREYKIFDSDEEGNIVISYFNQHGQPYTWKKEDTKWPRQFVRKRLVKPIDDMKYYQEGGSGQYPFFNPGIIEKYKVATAPTPKSTPKDKKKTAKNKVRSEQVEEGIIHTLFLIEGEFKSYKGYLSGLDIIGLPSIHGFYNGDVKGKLHEDIADVIIKCKVKKIIFLMDADVLTLNWAEDKDLHKRPASFYGSIKAFRESLQLLLDDDKVDLEMIYYMHIETKFNEEAKGLDDLFCRYSAVTVEIVEDLFQFNFARKYFKGFVLNDLNKDVQGRIYRYFGLQDEQEFYKTYKDFIGSREFKFKRRKYIYDPESKEVKFMRHEDVDKFMRIGADWVKVISKANKHGEPEEEIVPWKISEIERDYKKKYPDFTNEIPRYDDFCNEPAWGSDYKPIHNGCFNVCRPLKHKPEAGGISSTIGFLKHIFQGNGKVIFDATGRVVKEESITGDQFTVALDYLTIQLRHPKQMLPVPILVSPENGTGKSTFLKWLQQLYGSNMCILGNAQFQMKFNSHYITKYIISIDEGFLEVDKKAEKERLKQLVTADSAFVEFKGMNVRKINYYSKLIICSNDADRVMKIEDGESRWFVVRVPVIPRISQTGQQLIDRGYKSIKGKEVDSATTYQVPDADPDLEDKLKKELPAWLDFLFTRQIHHPRVNRLWFDPEWFITDQFKIIVETTKNRVDRVFEDWLREQFMLYRLPTLRYTLGYLTQVFNDPKNSKYKIDAIELKTYLKDKLKKELEQTQRISIPVGYDVPEDPGVEPKIRYIRELGRPFVFYDTDWITKEQRESWTKPIGEDLTVKEQGLRDSERIHKQSVATQQMIEESRKLQLTIGPNGYPESWETDQNQ